MTETPECPAECWPPRDSVAKLVEAVTHLLDAHDCDADGYEQFKSARDVAATWIASSLGEPVSQEAPTLDLGKGETWLTVEQEVNRDLVGSLQILESFTGTAEGKRFHAKKVRDLFARLLGSRSAFSGIPRTENEHRCGVRGFDGMKGDVCPACSRLSASAPSPEDKGSKRC